MLGDNFINTINDEKVDRYDHQMIDAEYLKEKVNDFTSYFYICGPDPMVESIQGILLKLGAAKDKVVTEEF